MHGSSHFKFKLLNGHFGVQEHFLGIVLGRMCTGTLHKDGFREAVRMGLTM